MVDASGEVAVHTGADCIPCAGDVVGAHWTCQANMMASDTVPAAMSAAFERSQGDLADRLMTALEAAEDEGGDVRGRQSAALIVVPADGEPWQMRVQLRVEDHTEPRGRAAAPARPPSRVRAGRPRRRADGGRLRRPRPATLYRRAADLAPASDELLFWAGLALAHTGDLDTGVDAVRRAIDDHGGWGVLLDRLSTTSRPPDPRSGGRSAALASRSPAGGTRRRVPPRPP